MTHAPAAYTDAISQSFGKLLETLRFRHDLKQAAIYRRLGWSADRYSRLESDLRAPLFDDLPAIALALHQAGVVFSVQDVHEFVAAARQRLARQKTYKDTHSDEAWDALLHGLLRELSLVTHEQSMKRPLHLLETRHLLARESWHQDLLACFDSRHPVKLLIMTGAPGVGKSSELSWLVVTLSRQAISAPQCMLCDLRALAERGQPEAALRLLLGTLSTKLRMAPPQVELTLAEQTTLTLSILEQLTHRLVVLVDHAECLLEETGQLARCWEQFFSRVLRSGHPATFVLATRQWPGWFSGESIFVAERIVPALSHDDSVQLLHRLGLDAVEDSLLGNVARRVGGIPRGLEWVAALVRQPLAADEWQKVFAAEQGTSSAAQRNHLTATVEQLLTDPFLFVGSQADDIAPVLAHIIERQHLSRDAHTLLEVLALSPVPLGQPALVSLCQAAGTRPLKELRRASLLVAYEQRVHVNALVSSAVIRQFVPQERREREKALIEAYQVWLDSGQCDEHEAGTVVYELARLLLQHHRLLAAAQYLLRYGWLAFHLGYTGRLAVLALATIEQDDQVRTDEDRYGRAILQHFLAPLLGRPIEREQVECDYRRIQDAMRQGTLTLWPLTEIYLTRILAAYLISRQQFEEARLLIDETAERITALHSAGPDVRAALLEVQALFLAGWSTFLAERDHTRAVELREQTIAFYRQGCEVLKEQGETALLAAVFCKKRLARLLTNEGYQLDRLGRYEEALSALEQSRLLKEQGYVEPGSLAATYDELAQAHAGLGSFRDALRLCELALAENGRFAEAGDTLARNERWIFQVTRGSLLLHTGKIEEAEQILRTACEHIDPTRSAYIMTAKQHISAIETWRSQHPATPYQLDWRWIGRLREALAFNSLWWLTHAGPFTNEEQAEWDQLLAQSASEDRQHRLETLLRQSRERELAAALSGEREPRLHYPVIPLEEVRERIERLRLLDHDMRQEEPNRIVRDLYHETIAERIAILRLIEAAATRDREQFSAYNQFVYPLPTHEEMAYTLEQVKRLVLLGLAHDHTRAASQHVIQRIREQLGIAWDVQDTASDEEQASPPLLPLKGQRLVSVQTVQRFIQATLRQHGYEEWHVAIDLNAHTPRVEVAPRLFVLPDTRFSLEEIKFDLLPNEVIHHIGDAIAGEQSLLGILSIGTRGYMPISEGRALYHEMQTATALGKPFDDSKVWLGTLSAGLASGIISTPQSFRQLYLFLRAFLVLYRLLRRPDQDEATAHTVAHELAIALCLRVFRGVPELERAGVCYSKDVVYLRGLCVIEQAVAQDVTILERLAVGRIALEHLPAIEELGITPPLQPLWKLAHDPDLDSYILSFEQREDDAQRASS